MRPSPSAPQQRYASPARIESVSSDPVWDVLLSPVAGTVWRLSKVLNALQFLTIRRYLGFVFAALVILLPDAGAMAMIQGLLVQGAQMTLLLLLARCSPGWCAR